MCPHMYGYTGTQMHALTHMDTHTLTCAHTSMDTQEHRYTHTHIQTCAHTYMDTQTYTDTQICKEVINTKVYYT